MKKTALSTCARKSAGFMWHFLARTSRETVLSSSSSNDCNQWVVNAWAKVKPSSIIKKAKELGMCAEPGPPVEGYVDDLFEDVDPQGAEEEYGDAELWQNLIAFAESEE